MPKRFLVCLALALTGCVLVGTGSPWPHGGMLLLILAAVLALSGLRDAIQRRLQRAGRNVDRFTVQLHVAAVLMAAFAAWVTSDDTDPRMPGIRWPLIVGLPLAVYFLGFVLRLLERWGRR